MSITNSTLPEWCSLLKCSTELKLTDALPDISAIRIEVGNLVPNFDISNEAGSPALLDLLTGRMFITWLSDPRYILTLWNFITNTWTVSRFTNEKLNRFGLMESLNCTFLTTFCREEPESIKRLPFSCDFWKHVLSRLKDKRVYVDTIKESDLLFWKFYVDDTFHLINHALLLGKYHFYFRKCLSTIARARRVYNIELHIARKK